MARRGFFDYGWRHWWRGAVDSLVGTRFRAALSAAALAAFALVVFGVREDGDSPDAEEKLQRAINLAHQFEQENRDLRAELANEKRLRRVANQTSTALSEQVRQQDLTILDHEQQLAFYRQLLEERDSDANEVVIRSFAIVPDYRENSFLLLAVLNRSGSDRELFKGKLDLALSIRERNGNEVEHRPSFEIGALDAEFRYYVEIEVAFAVPDGSEILNGQLALFDDEGNLMSSRLLHDQTL